MDWIDDMRDGDVTDPPDVILLQGMHFFGFHGLQPEERVIGHRFEVDVEMQIDLRAAGSTDDISASLSYSEAFRRVRAIMEGPPFTIIEAVTEAIAQDLLATYPTVTRVTVTLRKPLPNIAGSIIDHAAIRIHRRRND